MDDSALIDASRPNYQSHTKFELLAFELNFEPI